MKRRSRREFTDAYKAEVVGLCEKGDRSIAEVARDLDLTETSGRRWVAQAEVDAGRKPGAPWPLRAPLTVTMRASGHVVSLEVGDSFVHIGELKAAGQ